LYPFSTIQNINYGKQIKIVGQWLLETTYKELKMPRSHKNAKKPRGKGNPVIQSNYI
jgi:hypothetical protein